MEATSITDESVDSWYKEKNRRKLKSPYITKQPDAGTTGTGTVTLADASTQANI